MPPYRFSIITVVYNGRDLLPGTAQSVLNQTYPHIEYLIIDGGSKDGTVDIIADFQKKMPNLRWISEPDKGLYDAMNKGLKMATGDFVWFLNAGDHLYAPDTTALLSQKITSATDVLYGDTMLVNEARQPQGLMSVLSTRALPQNLKYYHYLGGMRVVHQSFLARTSLCEPYIMENLCADYDWCIKILKKSRETVYSGLVLSNYLMGGISKKRHQQSLKDRFVIMRHHFGLFLAVMAHIWIGLRAVLHQIFRLGQKKY